MTADEALLEDAPCGLVVTRPDGTIVRVNRTFEALTGLHRDDLVGKRRLQDLLSAGGRIYHETHYAPLLRMQGRVREIAVDLVRADGTRLHVLLSASTRSDAAGEPELIVTAVFEAGDRRRYEQELLRARKEDRDIAHLLQRSLLTGELPEDDAFAVAVEYLPGVENLEVGGDWYDAFWTSERSVGLVVGDVVGRGLDAAAVMGQLRSAVRALASTGLAPGPLLEALDGYVVRHDVGAITTVAYAELHVDTGVLRVACAGHPPPAVGEPGGETWYVRDGRSAPLAAYDRPTPRPDTTLTLAPGAVLLLFTDGLIERAGRPLYAGLDEVLAELARRVSDPVAEIAAELPRTMLADRRSRDDVCVVVLRRATG